MLFNERSRIVLVHLERHFLLRMSGTLRMNGKKRFLVFQSGKIAFNHQTLFLSNEISFFCWKLFSFDGIEFLPKTFLFNKNVKFVYKMQWILIEFFWQKICLLEMIFVKWKFVSDILSFFCQNFFQWNPNVSHEMATFVKGYCNSQSNSSLTKVHVFTKLGRHGNSMILNARKTLKQLVKHRMTQHCGQNICFPTLFLKNKFKKWNKKSISSIQLACCAGKAFPCCMSSSHLLWMDVEHFSWIRKLPARIEDDSCTDFDPVNWLN